MSNQTEMEFDFGNSNKKSRFTKFLSSKEKIFLYGAIFVFIVSLISWTIYFYFSSTKEVPDFGGEYTEGIIGEPLYVNPILAQSNEVDLALSNLIFSSLLKYDEKANLVNDLAENYELSEDKKTYTFKIKQGVLWQDGKELKANDIYFTVKLIQDPSFKSSLRGNWEKIRPEVIDDYTIKFTLEKPFVAFLNNLTFGILPEHVFGEIPADKFLITDLNLKPIGSGPFVFSDFKKDDHDNIISYQIIANKDYYGQPPYLKKINFNFYSNDEELINAYIKKEINGFGFSSYEMLDKIQDRKDSVIKSLRMPRYFALFFNQTKSVPLADKNVRNALQYATNKQEIIEQVFYGKATEVNGPILNEFGAFQSNSEIEKIEYNPEKSKEILEEAGWKINNDDGLRYKNETPLSITITTTTWIDLKQTAEFLKNQWEPLGIKVEINNASISEFQQNFVRPRDYEVLLFGQEYFGNEPDPYPFWHSSEKKDPGKNIALFDNKDVDKILEETRETYDLEKRQKSYNEFEKIVSDEKPALFLYSPNYVYVINRKIKGVETESIIQPSFRFSEANEWFINTKREKKEK